MYSAGSLRPAADPQRPEQAPGVGSGHPQATTRTAAFQRPGVVCLQEIWDNGLAELRRDYGGAMNSTITIDEAQVKLRELIHQLAPGEEIVIIEGQRPVARLVSEPSETKPGLRPPPGLGKGFITVISDDDEHLKDFEEYMP